jgi:hypothetical protein
VPVAHPLGSVDTMNSLRGDFPRSTLSAWVELVARTEWLFRDVERRAALTSEHCRCSPTRAGGSVHVRAGVAWAAAGASTERLCAQAR